MTALEQLADLEARVARGDELDPAEFASVCAALCSSLQSDPDQIPAEHAAEVVSRLEALAAWSECEKAKASAELSQLKSSRKALKGYNHLKSSKVAQRLFRQA